MPFIEGSMTYGESQNTQAIASMLFDRQVECTCSRSNRIAAAAGCDHRRGGHGEEENLKAPASSSEPRNWRLETDNGHATNISTVHYVVLAAALFLLGVVGVLNPPQRGHCVDVDSNSILNAVNLNLVAFSRYWQSIHGAAALHWPGIRHFRDHRRDGRSCCGT